MKKNLLTTLLTEVTTSKQPVTTIYYTTGDNYQKNTTVLERIQGTLESDPELLVQFKDVVNEHKLTELRLVTVAIFLTGDQHFVYQFDRISVDAFVSMKTTPFILPLVELKQAVPERIIVNLAYDEVNVYHVAENMIEQLTPKKPLEIKSVLGEQYRVGEVNSRSMGDKQLAVHGHNTEKRSIEHERFYRAVDEGVFELIQEEHADLPIILAGTPENITLFQDVSKLVVRNLDHNYVIKNQLNLMQMLYTNYKEIVAEVNKKNAQYILDNASTENIISADYTEELPLGHKQVLIYKRNYFTLPVEQLESLAKLTLNAYKMKLPMYFLDDLDASCNIVQVD